MYTLELNHHFDAAHFLPSHKGKCKRLHGHRWEVKVIIQRRDNVLSEGMIIDFGDIKKVVDELDHQELNKFVPIPTAELIAKYLHEKVKKLCKQKDKLIIKIWESPEALITYTNEGL